MADCVMCLYKGAVDDKPDSVKDNDLSRTLVAQRLKRPTCVEMAKPSSASDAATLRGLAPCGVCPAFFVTKEAVRSYRTFSPLPKGGLFSVALSIGFRRPGVTRHTAMWSPDFPPKDFSLSHCLSTYAHFK